MSEPFIGEIRIFAFTFAPRSYANCDGQLLPISQNSALFSLLGTTYGGDGRTTFALPDLRSRMPLHVGTGAGLPPYILGQRGGSQTQTLTINELPVHNHTATFEPTSSTIDIPCNSGNANTNDPTGATFAKTFTTGSDLVASFTSSDPNTTMKGFQGSSGGTVTVGNAGGNQAFSIQPPYLTVRFCIALQGIFPSRN